MARLRRPDIEAFEVGNAESWGEDQSCDVATVMFGMHEMPGDARRRVMRNALRLARKKVLVVDIWPGFEPSAMMVSGEPYLYDYLENIEGDVQSCIEVVGGEPADAPDADLMRRAKMALLRPRYDIITVKWPPSSSSPRRR